MAKTGNKQMMREVNRSLILNYLRLHGQSSRSKLTKETGLSAGAVSEITSELIENNYIFEKSSGESSGGRKPINLALNPDFGFVIGIKFMENQVIMAITNMLADVLSTKTSSYQTNTPENVILQLSKLIQEFIDEENKDIKNLVGIGIGMAGIIDVENGVLKYSPIIHWENVPFASLLSNQLNVPVFIDNDVNTFALTELWFGKGMDTDHFLTVTVGRGIGMGIVTNQKIYRGKGGAGEMGHVVVVPNGNLCECGNYGCLEAYISEPALLKEAQEKGVLSANDDVEKISELAKQGNQDAFQILFHAGELLGWVLSGLTNVFDTEFIIVGGEGLRSGEFFIDGMKDAFDKNVMPSLRGRTKLIIDSLGDSAWARGAAGLVLQEVFLSPLE